MAQTLIQTIVVGAGGQASISFGSVPAGFTDLLLVVSGRTAFAGNGDSVLVQFNGDTTTANYNYLRLLGNGSGVSSSGTTGFFAGYTSAANDTASTFGNLGLYLYDYAGSNVKNGAADSVSENNGTTAYTAFHVDKWSGTAAITSILLTPASATNFAQYTTATLYGIN